MMKKGDLYKALPYPKNPERTGCFLAEVVRTYDKPDIDPECPESGAILSMVEVVSLTGPDIGIKKRYRRNRFRMCFEKVAEAE